MSTDITSCVCNDISVHFHGLSNKERNKRPTRTNRLAHLCYTLKIPLKKKKKIIFWFFCQLGSSFIIRGILTLSTVSLILKLSCYYYYQYYVFHCIWTTSMHTRHRSTRSSRSFQRYRGEWDLSSVDQSFLRFLHQTWKECYVYILLNCCCCCCWFLGAILHR